MLRREFVNPAEFEAFRALAEKNRRAICALLFDLEEREALQQKCPGAWVEVSRLKNITLGKLDSAPPNVAGK